MTVSTHIAALQNDADFLADVHGADPIRTVAQRWGCSFGFVQRLRAEGPQEAPAPDAGYSFNERFDGKIEITKRSDRIIPLSEWLEDLQKDGYDPADFNTSHGHSVWSQRSTEDGIVTLYANKFSAVKKNHGKGSGPAWPIIQPAQPVVVTPPSVKVNALPRIGGYKVGLKCGDPQIGFRIVDGAHLPYHDEQAMALFVEVARLYQPNKITILGDFLDLPAQSHFNQEAGFAQTMQLSLNAGYRFLAELRAACPDAEMVLIEGNHDRRLQNFVETNMLAAFGLKRAEMPDEWPVMSVPYLLRLTELGVHYIDAYPAGVDWDNARTRNIHGTRANSNGSTMAQYLNDLPHINTWAGHTHRPEIVYKAVMGLNGEAIESYGANPGVLCRTDGSVPSVKGAIGASGLPAKVVEDWGQGLGIEYYNEDESIPQVYRIRDGAVLIGDRLISVAA